MKTRTVRASREPYARAGGAVTEPSARATTPATHTAPNPTVTHVRAAANRPSADAIDAAGRILAEARRVRDSLPVAEAAARAWTPTGPPLEVLEDMIRAQREGAR